MRRAAALIAAVTLACGRPDHRPEELRNTLARLRGAIAQYHAKHHRHPHALPDLIADGELRTIPADPVTGSSSTWHTTMRETVSVDDFTSRAAAPEASEIIEIHSGARGADPAGRAWSDY